MKQKKILYISYDGMTDALGEGQVISYLVELGKKGYQFDILSFEKPEKIGLRSKPQYKASFSGGFSVYWKIIQLAYKQWRLPFCHHRPCLQSGHKVVQDEW